MDSPAPSLLFSTAPFFRRPVRDAMEAAARAGFEGVEVMVTKDPETQDGERLSELAAAHDLRIGAIHAPFLIFTRRVFGTDPIRKVQRSVDLADAIGAPLVVAHPPYRWQGHYRRWLDAELPRLRRERGVIVAVENMFPLGFAFHGHHRMDDLARYPDLTLDTSHAAVSRLDLIDVAARHSERLRHIHLSNNNGRGWDSHLPIDEGVLPIPEFLETLADQRFAGSISLELDLRRWLDDPSELAEVLAANRRSCERRLPALA